MSVEEQLAWEARNRTRAAAAAIVAVPLTIAAGLISGLTYRDAPRSSLVDALDRGVDAGPVARLPSLRIPVFEYLHDHAAMLILGSALGALSYFTIAYALTYLANATRARRPEMPRPALYLALVGGVVFGIHTMLSMVAQQMAITEFLDGPRTVDAAEDVATGGLVVFAQVLYIPGALALALGFVFVSLNAMRAGLLTRFMGVLGIMIGVLLVFPLLPFGGSLMQIFWLAALGALFLGRWPGGVPPAWRSGQAEPWPSSRPAAVGAPTAEPEVATGPQPAGVVHPSSKKRKRKRRS